MEDAVKRWNGRGELGQRHRLDPIPEIQLSPGNCGGGEEREGRRKKRGKYGVDRWAPHPHQLIFHVGCQLGTYKWALLSNSELELCQMSISATCNAPLYLKLVAFFQKVAKVVLTCYPSSKLNCDCDTFR
jgi:hypothetical protein